MSTHSSGRLPSPALTRSSSAWQVAGGTTFDLCCTTRTGWLPRRGETALLLVVAGEASWLGAVVILV